MLRLTQFMRANARNQCIVFKWSRLGCKLFAQKPNVAIKPHKKRQGNQCVSKIVPILAMIN